VFDALTDGFNEAVVGNATGAEAALTRARREWSKIRQGMANQLVEIELLCRLLERADGPKLPKVESGVRTLVLDRSERRFRMGDGDWVACRRRHALFPILCALVDAHRADKDRSVDRDALTRTGWPDGGSPEDLSRRLRVSLTRLRALGLREVLETTDEGWRIAGGVAVVDETSS